MNAPVKHPDSALDLARHTRAQLAEVRAIVLKIAAEYHWDEDMTPKIEQIEVGLGKAMQGINALLKSANAKPEAE